MTIYYQIPEPNSVGRPSWLRPIYESLSDFKNLAAAAVKVAGAQHLPPSGRKWRHEDVVAVLIYAWLRGVSVHHAAQKLDVLAIARRLHVPVTFADGRHSRGVPHQTSVNA